jgi:tRNA pseudouridine38-40 synthase
MAIAAQNFCGQHDFGSFAANRGTPETDSIRTIHRVRVKRSGPWITVEIEGDGFLYKMVRMMIGALVRIGLGTGSPSEIKARLKAPRHVNRQGRNAAPAAGLFLVRVRY